MTSSNLISDDVIISCQLVRTFDIHIDAAGLSVSCWVVRWLKRITVTWLANLVTWLSKWTFSHSQICSFHIKPRFQESYVFKIRLKYPHFWIFLHTWEIVEKRCLGLKIILTNKNTGLSIVIALSQSSCSDGKAKPTTKPNLGRAILNLLRKSLLDWYHMIRYHVIGSVYTNLFQLLVIFGCKTL